MCHACAVLSHYELGTDSTHWWTPFFQNIFSVALKSPIGVELRWELSTAKAIAYDLQHFHTPEAIQWADVGGVIVKDHTYQDRNVSAKEQDIWSERMECVYLFAVVFLYKGMNHGSNIYNRVTVSLFVTHL